MVNDSWSPVVIALPSAHDNIAINELVHAYGSKVISLRIE